MEEGLNKIKVACAMSGGVDSSVSAALLKEAGFEVTGVFAQLAGDNKEAESRAKETAKLLGVNFKVLDFKKEFKEKIIEAFVADIKRGVTPNPCVVCNREIKFGLLLDKVSEMGFDAIATGHYARIKRTKDGQYKLFKGADKAKDQSYFLWQLGQKQLGHVLFPVGCFTKPEVRDLAKKWNLPAAETAESQEACFIGGDIEKFLQEYFQDNPGDIVDATGKVMGKHRGLWFYTIGQRKGIKLPGGPFYVLSKDYRKNELVITDKVKQLKTAYAKLSDVHWISEQAPTVPLRVKARVRYRSKEVFALLSGRGHSYELEYSRSQFAVTPGQSAVFYKGQELLGGGIIEA